MSETNNDNATLESLHSSNYDKFSSLEEEKPNRIKGILAFLIYCITIATSTTVGTVVISLFFPALLSEKFFIWGFLLLFVFAIILFIIINAIKKVMVMPLVFAFIFMLIPMGLISIELWEELVVGW